MALSRFVVTNTVTLTPDTAALLVASEPGTGAPSAPGNAATVAPGSSGKYGLTFIKGRAVYADSTPAGTTRVC